jgi:hypothetical protein
MGNASQVRRRGRPPGTKKTSVLRRRAPSDEAFDIHAQQPQRRGHPAKAAQRKQPQPRTGGFPLCMPDGWRVEQIISLHDKGSAERAQVRLAPATVSIESLPGDALRLLDQFKRNQRSGSAPACLCT